MFKRLLNNKKGAAEVVGSVMFIIILLFFFTNVYLWHDAAVKEMNDLYAEKLNSQISIIGYDSSSDSLLVKNNGGVDATIECFWINHGIHIISDTTPDYQKVVRAGSDPLSLPLNGAYGGSGVIEVVTTTGNIAQWKPSPP
jgi:hypothetical protein